MFPPPGCPGVPIGIASPTSTPTGGWTWSSDPREPGYQLGRPSADVTLVDVLAAVRGAPDLPTRKGGVRADSAQIIGGVVAELARASEPVAGKRSLGDLLQDLPERRAEKAARVTRDHE